MFSDGFKSYHRIFSYFTIIDAKNDTISLKMVATDDIFHFCYFLPDYSFHRLIKEENEN